MGVFIRSSHEQRRHYSHGSQDAQRVLHAASRLFDWPLDGLFDLGASMKRDDIIRIAREATKEAPREDWNSTAWVFGDETLERFAALIASAERERLTEAAMKAAEKAVDVAMALEREACAQMLEAASKTGKIISCTSAANAIRERGKHD